MPESEKVFVFSVAGTGPTVASPEPADFFGIPCIKGRGVAHANRGNWAEGMTVYIPISRIEQVVVFDSMEQFQSSFDRYQEKRKQTPPA